MFADPGPGVFLQLTLLEVSGGCGETHLFLMGPKVLSKPGSCTQAYDVITRVEEASGLSHSSSKDDVQAPNMQGPGRDTNEALMLILNI